MLLALGMRDALWPLDPLALTLLLVLAAPRGRRSASAGGCRGGSTPSELVAAGWLLSWRPPTRARRWTRARHCWCSPPPRSTARDGIREGAVVAVRHRRCWASPRLGPGSSAVAVHTLSCCWASSSARCCCGRCAHWWPSAHARERDLGAGDHGRARADRPRDPRPGRPLAERHAAAPHRRPARAARRARPVPADRRRRRRRGRHRAGRRRAGRAPGDGRHPAHRQCDGRRAGLAARAARRRRHRRPGRGARRRRACAWSTTSAATSTTLPAAAGLGLYRIAQESLANVAKHAATSTRRPGCR